MANISSLNNTDLLNPKDITNLIDKLNSISNKAHVLGIGLKEYDKALALTEAYLQKYPDHRGLLCTTAEIYRETGNDGIAQTYQEKLDKIEPNYKCGLIEKISKIESEAFL